MATLLEEEEAGANGEDTSHLITGSELVIAGGIPRGRKETEDLLVSETITRERSTFYLNRSH